MNLEELNRMTTSFAAVLREQQRQVEAGMRTVSTALERAADRLAALIGTTAGAPPAIAAPAAAGGAGPPGPGPFAVRIVNAPLHVLVDNLPTGGSHAAAIGTGVGGFFGGLIGGIAGAFAAPFIGLADLVVAVTGGLAIVSQLRGLLRELRAFATELVTSLRGLVTLLFSELTAAGIFPVSRLIAGLLFLIDRGITLVLAHVRPIIVWAERLIETTATWLGTYISRVVSWVGSVVNALATFLADFATSFIDAVVRPALHRIITDLATVVIGGLYAFMYALRDQLIALIDHGLARATRLFAQLENAFRSLIPGASPVLVPAAPTWPDFATIEARSAPAGRARGAAVVSMLVGPGPAPPGAAPRFRMPALRAPELHLPDMPAPAPQLEGVLQTPPAAAPAAAGGAATTLHGGVTVNVRAETVSMDNAEETARVIAVHLVDELGRLAQADRFGRGLPTGAAG